MPVRVVDASALGALVFAEPRAEQVANQLADASMAAPALLWFELASVCLKKLKAHPRQADKILAAFRLAQRLPIPIHHVDHAQVVTASLPPATRFPSLLSPRAKATLEELQENIANHTSPGEVSGGAG